MTDILLLVVAMAATGAFAGLVAGLFGIGGGVVMVPAMYYALSVLGSVLPNCHAGGGGGRVKGNSESMRAGGARGGESCTSVQMKSSREDWPAFGEAPGERPLPLPLPRPLATRSVEAAFGEERGGRPLGLAGRGTVAFVLDLACARVLVAGGTGEAVARVG